ncbi:TetR/AcrR family transcriptional regulator [Streptosporangium sp. G11]|uniref:TetR/AcrR family transcriptional regulator n=1 Tax=Streptosporangium sp. G11 TaxID=3436926 RepID=UPI003EB965A9
MRASQRSPAGVTVEPPGGRDRRARHQPFMSPAGQAIHDLRKNAIVTRFVSPVSYWTVRSSKHGTPQDRVARVLRAGATCFGRKGFFETTFEDVVRESGLSRGSLYWYFDSKDALYNAVLEHCAARFRATFDAGIGGIEGDDPIVSRFLKAVVADVIQQEDVYRVLYLAPRSESAAETLTQLTLSFVDYVRLVVEAAGQRGEIDTRRHSREALADILHALAEGLIIRRLFDPGFDTARYVTTAADLLGCGGERSRAAGPPDAAHTGQETHTDDI